MATIKGQGQSGIHPAELLQKIRHPKIVSSEEPMAIRKPGRGKGGKKFGSRELRNKEEQARAGEPLLMSKDEIVKEVQGTWDPKLGTAMHPDLVRGDRKRKAEAVWVSPEPTDLDALARGETSIDYSKGRWLKPKRDTLLLDDLLRYDHGALGMAAPPRLKLLTAQRFSLDWAATVFFAETTMNWGKAALLQHEMARAPYELCWIEWDADAFGSVVETRKMDSPEDTRVGMLYDHGKIYIASETTAMAASFLPYFMTLNVPMAQEDEARMAAFFRADVPAYRAYLLGQFGDGGKPFGVTKEWLMSPEVTGLFRSHRFEVIDSYVQLTDQMGMTAKARQDLLFSMAGTFKQIIILLILMTRPNKHVYFGEAHQPARRVWLGNRQVAAVSYNTITMHLEQKEAIRRIGSEVTGIHRKEHDVKEHWCQSRKKGRGCEHHFVLSDPKHGECAHGCGAKIWWKKPHKRGDASLGTVAKTYKVTE